MKFSVVQMVASPIKICCILAKNINSLGAKLAAEPNFHSSLKLD